MKAYFVFLASICLIVINCQECDDSFDCYEKALLLLVEDIEQIKVEKDMLITKFQQLEKESNELVAYFNKDKQQKIASLEAKVPPKYDDIINMKNSAERVNSLMEGGYNQLLADFDGQIVKWNDIGKSCLKSGHQVLFESADARGNILSNSNVRVCQGCGSSACGDFVNVRGQLSYFYVEK